MPQAIIRETVYASGAEALYRELEALDPDFRRAARVTNVDYNSIEEYGFGNLWSEVSTIQVAITFEAPVSP